MVETKDNTNEKRPMPNNGRISNNYIGVTDHEQKNQRASININRMD